ncbi:hypothetical protein Tco_1578730 [Tanacetum coccineum]
MSASSSQDEIPPPPPPPPSSQTPTQQTPHTVFSTIKLCKRNVGSIKSRYGGKTNPKKKAKVYLESTVLKESLNPKHRRASQRRRDAWNSGNKDGSRTVQKEDSKALVTIDEEVLVGEKEGNRWLRPSAVSNMETTKIHGGIQDYPHKALKNKGIVDSGCSRHMTGNKAYLALSNTPNWSLLPRVTSIALETYSDSRQALVENLDMNPQTGWYSISRAAVVKFEDIRIKYHFPINTLTSKVFSFMVKKGKHFSGKVTPLFAPMLVQLTQDEGASSERPSEALPTPSPAPTSEIPLEQQTDLSPRPSPTPTIPDSTPEASGENLGGHSSSDRSLSGNEGDMTLQSVYDLCLSLCAQVSDQAKEIQDLKAQITKLKKQAKPVIKHHKAYLKSVSLKQRFPRKSFSKKHRVHKESVSKQGRKYAKGESSVQRDPLFDEVPEDTVDHMDTENAQDEGRTMDIVDEDKEFEENVLSTEDVLSTDKEGVSTDIEKVSTDRPIVSTDGSKVSTDKQIEGTDEQVEGTEEPNEGTEEQNEDTVENFEGTEENIEGTEEKVESTDGHKKGTEEEIAAQATQTSTQTPTSKIFGDDETIAKVLLNMSQAKAVSREKEKGVELKDVEETDRPKPTSTRSLLTLKPLPKIDPKDKGKKKIEEEDESKSEKIKKFEEVQALHEKIKRSDEDFISIGSAEDERLIKKEESKEEESKRKRKLGTRKKMKSRKRRYIQNTSEDDSDKENDELRLHLTIAPDEEKEVDYEILDRKYPIKEWKTECLGTKPQTNQAEGLEELNQNIFKDEIPEGYHRVLLGRFDGYFFRSTYFSDRNRISHPYAVEKKYPLKKEVLMQMLKLKLGDLKTDSTMAIGVD